MKFTVINARELDKVMAITEKLMEDGWIKQGDLGQVNSTPEGSEVSDLYYFQVMTKETEDDDLSSERTPAKLQDFFGQVFPESKQD